jgi:signal transduction histidine kinase
VPAPEPRWIEVSASRVSSSDGDRAPQDWILVLRDTTQTEERRQLFDDVLTLLAHELRTPLATIRGFAENLVDSIEGPVNERQREVLARIIRTSRRSIRLLENVLESARCRTGHAPVSAAEFDLGRLAAEAAESLRPTATEKGVAVHVEAESSLPPLLNDADKIEQVMLNLLSNSIKNTPRGGSIRLRVSRPETGVVSIVRSLGDGDGLDDGEFAQVTVEDTGVGIPPQDLERIFERFQRAGNSRDSALGSFGLGLWICRDIVSRIGGRICIQSELNVGTRVSVLVPLRLETGAAAGGESPEAAR